MTSTCYVPEIASSLGWSIFSDPAVSHLRKRGHLTLKGRNPPFQCCLLASTCTSALVLPLSSGCRAWVHDSETTHVQFHGAAYMHGASIVAHCVSPHVRLAAILKLERSHARSRARCPLVVVIIVASWCGFGP